MFEVKYLRWKRDFKGDGNFKWNQNLEWLVHNNSIHNSCVCAWPHDGYMRARLKNQHYMEDMEGCSFCVEFVIEKHQHSNQCNRK